MAMPDSSQPSSLSKSCLSASEVAEDLALSIYGTHQDEVRMSFVIRAIEALTAFREECVKEERAKPIYGPSVIEALEKARAEALDKAAKEIPSTWLDPLLSGKAKVSELPWNCPEIQLFCKKLVERICSLKEKP